MEANVQAILQLSRNRVSYVLQAGRQWDVWCDIKSLLGPDARAGPVPVRR